MKKLCLLLLIVSINIGYVFAPVNTMQDMPVIAYKKYQHILKAEQKQEEIDQFLYKLAMLESSNNWRVYNPYGYMGTWQMGEAALTTVGYPDIKFADFKVDPNVFPPELQREAMIKLMKYNSDILMAKYEHYIGTYVNGVKISKYGLLAAAHLGGVGSVQQYLNSQGQINNQDAYNTSIKDYLNYFKNYS